MSNRPKFIPCVQWIRRGIAKSKPEMVHLTKKDQRYIFEKFHTNQHKLKGAEMLKHDTKSKVDEKFKLGSGNEENNEDEFKLEDYDKDEQSYMDIENIMCFDDSDNENTEKYDEDEEEDSEKEDDEIKPTDNLIAVAQVCGDSSFLEVYVYNEEANDLYVHHDTMLPSIPLCMDWMSYDSANTCGGNLLAIGSITPEIYIWNLDIVNSIEPHAKLGMFTLKKRYQHRMYGHTDAVLDLSWNSKLLHIIASGSVDRSVLLWDLDKKRPVTKFNKFQEKVQTLQWHPTEANILLAGSCDGNFRLMDCRATLDAAFEELQVVGEVEKLSWHPSNPFNALIGTSKGKLYYADLRTKKFLWKIQAHLKEITGIGIHQDDPNSLVTCSTDQSIKTWNLLPNKKPVLLNTKYLKQGIQCLQMCPENPNIFCVGGDGKENNFSIQLVKDTQDSQVPEYSDDSQEISHEED